MVRLKRLLARLARDERGMTTVEYAIVLCLIAAVSVKAWETFGGNIKSRLDAATTTIDEPMKTAVGDGN